MHYQIAKPLFLFVLAFGSAIHSQAQTLSKHVVDLEPSFLDFALYSSNHPGHFRSAALVEGSIFGLTRLTESVKGLTHKEVDPNVAGVATYLDERFRWGEKIVLSDLASGLGYEKCIVKDTDQSLVCDQHSRVQKYLEKNLPGLDGISDAFYFNRSALCLRDSRSWSCHNLCNKASLYEKEKCTLAEELVGYTNQKEFLDISGRCALFSNPSGKNYVKCANVSPSVQENLSANFPISFIPSTDKLQMPCVLDNSEMGFSCPTSRTVEEFFVNDTNIKNWLKKHPPSELIDWGANGLYTGISGDAIVVFARGRKPQIFHGLNPVHVYRDYKRICAFTRSGLICGDLNHPVLTWNVIHPYEKSRATLYENSALSSHKMVCLDSKLHLIENPSDKFSRQVWFYHKWNQGCDHRENMILENVAGFFDFDTVDEVTVPQLDYWTFAWKWQGDTGPLNFHSISGKELLLGDYSYSTRFSAKSDNTLLFAIQQLPKKAGGDLPNSMQSTSRVGVRYYIEEQEAWGNAQELITLKNVEDIINIPNSSEFQIVVANKVVLRKDSNGWEFYCSKERSLSRFNLKSLQLTKVEDLPNSPQGCN